MVAILLFDCASVAKLYADFCCCCSVTFIFRRMLGMQNEYEMLRMAVCTLTSLFSVKLLILPNTFTREVLDLYFLPHGTSQTSNLLNGC